MKWMLLAGVFTEALTGMVIAAQRTSAPSAETARPTAEPAAPTVRGVIRGPGGAPLTAEQQRQILERLKSPSPTGSVTFGGADGKPVPPEVQRQIIEQLKNTPSAPAPTPGATPVGEGDDAAKPATPDQSDRPTEEPAAPTTPKLEFRSTDGKPLPPELQRQLTEQLKNNTPLTSVAGPSAASPANDGEVVVNARRPRGSVTGDIPPERSLSQLDLKAFGADNVSTLLDALGPQVASNRGRGGDGPVVLLNGRRVSGLSEVARIPSEAIERIEIFPEELALKYGYRADQKIVNVVTHPRFRTRVGQATALLPTDGGRETGVINFDQFAIRDDTRMALGASYSRASNLLESERDIRQPAGTPELARARTLLPETEQIGLNGLVAGRVLGDVNATLTGRLEASRSDSLLGLDGQGPLRRDSDRRAAQLGTTLGGRRGGWQWTLTGNYDFARTDIDTDVAGASIRRDNARAIDQRANADLLVTGSPMTLPAGPVTASLRGGLDFRDFESRSLRGDVMESADLSRNRGAGQVNIDLPLVSRQGASPSRFGNLSANANLAVDRLSDVGTLRTFGYGLNWAPTEAISLIVSATAEEGPPTLEQLGGPLLVTPNVRTFDIARNEIVDLTRVTGGNRALRSDDRHVLRLGLNARPLAKTDLTVSVDFTSTRIDDPIAAFPIVTPQIEAAFPDRFGRDAEGRLQRIDARAINFSKSRQGQIRWGVNFTRPLGPVPDWMQNTRVKTYTSMEEAQRLNPGAVFTRSEPGSEMARASANLTSRVFLSLYHNWFLRDAITLRDGGPKLDLLDGGAVDFRGGRRQHQVEFQAGAAKRGLGGRITATWQSGTEIRGAEAAPGDLRFADIAVVNLNLFANLGERFGGTKAPAWLKGARATIGVNNVFNTRPQVRDRLGMTPLSYQPAYLDPLGRTLSLNLRKVF